MNNSEGGVSHTAWAQVFPKIAAGNEKALLSHPHQLYLSPWWGMEKTYAFDLVVCKIVQQEVNCKLFETKTFRALR